MLVLDTHIDDGCHHSSCTLVPLWPVVTFRACICASNVRSLLSVNVGKLLITDVIRRSIDSPWHVDIHLYLYVSTQAQTWIELCNVYLHVYSHTRQIKQERVA